MSVNAKAVGTEALGSKSAAAINEWPNRDFTLQVNKTRKGGAAHLVLRLITWKHVPAGQFLGRLGMTINYSKPHLIANTMSCVLFDSRDSSAAFRLSPARGVAMTSMLRIKNAADSS